MPTINERLADHFIKAAGITGVYADARGAIGVVDVVGIQCDRSQALFCCTAGRQGLLAERAATKLQPRAGRAAAVAAICAAAAELRFGLTPHETVIRRAFAAVAGVTKKMAELQNAGGMKELNRAFKAARAADPSLRYYDFIHAKKIEMLEAIARQK
jgi:hypothetical protein